MLLLCLWKTIHKQRLAGDVDVCTLHLRLPMFPSEEADCGNHISNSNAYMTRTLSLETNTEKHCP